ncbi:MAG: hypothetical protein U0903_17835 [Planctomycetales bacterium]
MGSGMGDGLDFFHGPAQSARIREILRSDAEELLHLLQSFAFVSDVVDAAGIGSLTASCSNGTLRSMI